MVGEYECVERCSPDLANAPDRKVIFRAITQATFPGWKQAAPYRLASGERGFVMSDISNATGFRVLRYDGTQGMLVDRKLQPTYADNSTVIKLDNLWSIGTLNTSVNSRLVISGEGTTGTMTPRHSNNILHCSLENCTEMQLLIPLASTDQLVYVDNSFSIFGDYDATKANSRIYSTIGYVDNSMSMLPTLLTYCQQNTVSSKLVDCPDWKSTGMTTTSTRYITQISSVDQIVAGSLHDSPSPDAVLHAQDGAGWGLLALFGDNAKGQPDSRLALAETTRLLGLADLNKDGRSDSILLDSQKIEVQAALYSFAAGSGNYLAPVGGTKLPLPAGEVLYQAKLVPALERDATQQLMVLSGPAGGQQAHLAFFDLALQGTAPNQTLALTPRDAVQLVDAKMQPLPASTIQITSSTPAKDDVLVAPLDADDYPDLVVRNAQGITILLRVTAP
jgi:hypothetical protein